MAVSGDGFRDYTSAQLHEAGYDAYITGVAYTTMLKYMQGNMSKFLNRSEVKHGTRVLISLWLLQRLLSFIKPGVIFNVMQTVLDEDIRHTLHEPGGRRS